MLDDLLMPGLGLLLISAVIGPVLTSLGRKGHRAGYACAGTCLLIGTVVVAVFGWGAALEGDPSSGSYIVAVFVMGLAHLALVVAAAFESGRRGPAPPSC